ncbi:MAG TPA: RMD1 family protein [Gammaproteobacteria bacterium]
MQAAERELSPIADSTFKARALLLGERLDLRAWKAVDALTTNPLTVKVRGGGVATLYRHGVVVLFGVHGAEEAAFLAQLEPFVIHPYPQPEIEELDARIEGAEREGLAGGVVLLADAGVERLQVLADVLSKSVLLSLYERKVAGEFDRIEPLAAELGSSGRIPRHSKELLKMIGSMVLVEQRMVGRAEIADKPEILWDNPSLEALFVKVEDEFEISARHAALERKLNLIAQTAQTVMQLLSSKHSLRVEWYIVILILVEIVLTLYQLFLR